MGVVVDTAVLELRTDGGAFFSDVDKAEQKTEGLGSKLQSIGKSLGLYNGELKNTGTSILKVNADIAKQPSLLGSITTALGPVGTALAGTFAVTSIIAAGKKVIDYAGHVTDLSQRLKISTDTVQKWEAAFGPAGVSIDTAAKASEKLSLNLTSGDKGAVNTLKAMGFELEKLKAMKPEDRFIAVADAVGKLEDQGEKLYASKALFGKGGPELLAALDGHLGETIEKFDAMGLVIDQKTIKAADDFGDQLGMMGKQLLAIVASIIGPLLPALSALGTVLMWIGQNVIQPVLNVAIKAAITFLGMFWEVLSDVLGRLASLGAKLPFVGEQFQALSTWLKSSSKSTGEYLTTLWKNTEKTGESAAVAAPKLLGLGGTVKETGTQAKRAATSVEDLGKQIQASREIAAGAGPAIAASFNGGLNVLRDMAIQMGTLQASWVQLVRNLKEGTNADLPKLLAGGSLDALQIPQLLTKMPMGPVGLQAGHKFMAGFSETIRTELGPMIVGAFQGGGDVLKTIGAGLGSNIAASILGEPGKGGLGDFLTKHLGDTLGGALGSVLPGIGALAGSLLGKGIDALLHIGGPSKAELAGRDLEAAFERGFGGFDQMMAKVGDAYAATGRSAEQAQVDVARMLNAEKLGADATKAAIETINAVLEEQKTAVDKVATAEQLAQAARTEATQKATAELDAMMKHRDDLAKSIASEAPEEVMGVIEMQTRGQMDALDAQIKQQQAALEEQGRQAAASFEATFGDIHPNAVHVPIVWDYPAFEQPELYPMAAGGFGEVTRPTLFLAGERGREQVAFSGANREFGAAPLGNGDVVSKLDALLMQGARQAAELPRAIARAVTLRLQTV